MKKFYEELVEGTESERNNLLSIPILQSGVKGEITIDQYKDFLTQAYHHVKYTVPLLMACGSILPEEYEWLREAIGEYIEEEMGHQEWVLNDISALGGDKEAIRVSQPNIETEVMVSYAWDTIHRLNPIGFFGMVFVLEGTSIALATQAAESIKKKNNLGNEAFSYLNSHGSLDIEHVAFFENLMNKVTNQDDKDVIVHCAKVFYKLYGDIFRSIQ
ncbi:MAG: iron-containing redox enzyme family protein [Gammaproteobacteria bacterium]